MSSAAAPAPISPNRLAVHYSSASVEWETPQNLYDALNAEFHFTRDVCASAGNHKHLAYWTVADDALSRKWEGTLWMNPPYGRVIGQWVAKAHAAACDGATVVCLVPARTDTAWFQDYCRYAEVRFLRGRLKFNGHHNSAPFPSAVVIFHGHLDPGGSCSFGDAR